MQAEIWFDIICGWCFMGARRWRAATGGAVPTRWRSFQLDPDAPAHPTVRPAELMRTDWGMTDAQADATVARVRGAGAELGLTLNVESVLPVNTRDAHRLVHLAAAHGRTDDVLERLFAAYHTELRDISDHATLTELGTAAGVPDVAALWSGDRFVDAVARDRAAARAAGVTAVPSYRVDGRLVSGAVPVAELRALVQPSANQVSTR
jgi:predicted DsbA family dithiol-disulfide isomerase